MMVKTPFGLAQIGALNALCYVRLDAVKDGGTTCWSEPVHWFQLNGGIVGVCEKHKEWLDGLSCQYLGHSREYTPE